MVAARMYIPALAGMPIGCFSRPYRRKFNLNSRELGYTSTVSPFNQVNIHQHVRAAAASVRSVARLLWRGLMWLRAGLWMGFDAPTFVAVMQPLH
ncbi:hypothetical protein AVEN_266659-1 [Araneus ventricosus]|uniref:Uncharacterized protein n=1 Tax=Araneus ventricosus TaxID=182803 RepID=A0A4Y2LQL8_ARAVE|nr:hypothetical protein AVEN_266659-1 [Araneus ventricosus]